MLNLLHQLRDKITNRPECYKRDIRHVAIACALFFSWVSLWILIPELAWYLTWLGVFLWTIVGGLMLATPLFIDQLVNKPGKDSPSGPHYFTYLKPGQAKIIVRTGAETGGRVVRIMMLDPDITFKREGSMQAAKYWETEPVKDAKKGTNDDIFPEIAFFLRPWARYVFWAKGAVFTGLYHFQRVYEYKLPREKAERTAKTGEYEVTNRASFSDHFRTKTFVVVVNVPDANTNDGYAAKVLVELPMYVPGPYAAAFNVDDYYSHAVNLSVAVIRDWAAGFGISAFLASDNTATDFTAARNEATARLKKMIRVRLKEVFDTKGVMVESPNILDISVKLSDVEWERLRTVVQARRDAQASGIKVAQDATNLEAMGTAEKKSRTLIAEGVAAGLTAMIEATQKGGDIGTLMARLQAQVDTIKAAGSESRIILNIGGESTANTLQRIADTNQH